MGLIVKVNLQFLLLVLFSVYSTAVVITIIDNFTPATAPLFVSNQFTTNTTSVSGSSIGDETLGNERDQLLTILPGSANKLISSSVVDSSWSNAFLQNTTGYSIVQYDGRDNSPSLSLSPGLNGLDLTFSASAYAFYFQVTADLPAYYTINVYGSTLAAKSSYSFIFDPEDYVDPVEEVIVPFSVFTGTASFTSVYAIELVLNITDATVQNTAVDSAIFLFGIFGYEITGYVFLDCNNNKAKDPSENGISAAAVVLSDSNGNVIKNAQTNSTGFFQFRGLSDGTYTVCSTTPVEGATSTTPVGQCYTVTLQNEEDATGLLFGYTIATQINAPGNVTVPCGTCTSKACQGDAVAVGCGSTPTVTSNDVVTGTCPQVIARTFSAAGAPSKVQYITVTDTTAPKVETSATPALYVCSNKVVSITQWNNTHAGATVSDCSSVVWSSNYTGAAASNCGTTYVRFTATDACGNTTPFDSTYTVTDTVAPTISRSPANSSASCDIVGNSDQTAYNNWIANRANMLATDNCASSTQLIWSNTNPGVINHGCNVVQQVTFIANDGCGNSVSASASFTVTDLVNPSITKVADNVNLACNQGDVSTTFSLWLSNHGYATATDNCATAGQLIWSHDFTGSVPSGCSAASTVTFKVTDPCGRFNTTTGTFRVTASTGPVLGTTAQPLNINCGDADSATTISNWLSSHGGATATDTCTGIDWTHNFVGAGSCVGANVTFTACNRCVPKLCVSTTTTATIVDAAAPTFTVTPKSENKPPISCEVYTEQAFETWLRTAGGAVVRDNCSPVQDIVITNNWPVGKTLTAGCNNAATVSFIATDLCGNSSPPAVATYQVVDDTPPTLSTPTPISGLDCDDSNVNSFNNWLNSHAGVVATDLCSNVTWSNNASLPFQKGCDVTQVVLFTASDTCGYQSSFTSSFNVVDNDPPRLTGNAQDFNTTCSSNVKTQVQTWLDNHAGATAVDDCTPVTWTHNYVSLTGACTLSAEVTFFANDQCGFTTQTTATFAVVDNQAPVIQIPAKSTSVACDANTAGALATWLGSHGGAVAQDSCQPDSSLRWTNNFQTAPTQCGSIEITFSVTDGCGRSTSTTAFFTVQDGSAPVIDTPARNVQPECDGNGNLADYELWVENNGGAEATDLCAVNITWTNTALPTGPVGCGSTTATFIVTDGCDNTASTLATYTVVDTKAPVIFPAAQDTVVQCDGQGNTGDVSLWLGTHGGASATDICSGENIFWNYEVVSQDADPFSCTNFTTYNFFATDECGNSANTTATIGITDDGAPDVLELPSPLTIECGRNNANQINNWLATSGGFVASDACSGITYSNDYEQQVNPGFGCFTLPVTFFASDACGHTIQQRTNLILEDNEDPQFVNFPPNLTLPCDADTTTDTTGFPEVSDLCFNNLAQFITFEDVTNDLPADPATPRCPGDHIIQRTFSVTDPCGNTASQTQIITVEIARASGPCDAAGCLCENECCPEPQATDCLTVDCLPQNCAASLCESVPCSCSFAKRNVEEFAVQFPDSPIPQCEPIYIFVHDDDENDDDDNDASLTVGNNKPVNYVMSDRPYTNDELERMKNLNHKKAQDVQVVREEVKETGYFQTIFNLF